MPPPISKLSKHFLFAVTILAAAMLLLGDGALAIVCLAAGLVALPLAYAGDANEIARAARKGRFCE